MAVSPADFYAYSRATGVQIPDDPYEKAKLVPEIKEFRQNQLRAPQQEQSKGPDPLSVGLGVGLALAGGLAGGLGIRKLLRGPAKSATAGVRQVNLGDMAGDIATAGRFRPRAANESIPTPSKVAQQIGEEEFVAYRPDPKEFVSRPVAEARRQAATSDLLNAAQMRREPYQLALGGEASPTLQSIRSSEFGPNLTQTRERALGLVSAEAPSRPLAAAPDQLTLFEQDINKGFTPRGYLEKTGAVAPIEDLTSVQQQSLPQVIDQKMNAVESAEDQVTGRMKTQLQRNEDLDMGQVEMLEDRASQQPNLTMAEDGPINSVASQLPDGLPVDQAEGVRSLSSQELADVAKADMIARRQEVAARGLIPGTLRFERALAESWASKPGFMPGTEEFRQRIALPRVIRNAVQAASADPLDPLGGLKERTVVNIGPNAEISSTAAGTAIRGASPVYDVAEPKVATRQIYGHPDALVPGAPDELMPDRPGIETAFQQIISQPQLPERTDPYALKRLKGGSPGIGVYGPELSYVPGAVGKATGEYSAAAGRTPGYVPAWILKQEQTPFSGTSTEGLNRALAKSGKSGTLAITSELGRREIAKENIVKSELLRRANIEGRDPQMILKQFGIGT
jgi:hypothetical protein